MDSKFVRRAASLALPMLIYQGQSTDQVEKSFPSRTLAYLCARLNSEQNRAVNPSRDFSFRGRTRKATLREIDLCPFSGRVTKMSPRRTCRGNHAAPDVTFLKLGRAV